MPKSLFLKAIKIKCTKSSRSSKTVYKDLSGNEIKVNVHDVRGREIFAKSYNNNGLFNESLELNNVQSGVYLVTVQDGARKEVKKIVVQ